ISNGIVLAGVFALFAIGADKNAEPLLPTAQVCASGTDPLGRCAAHVDLAALEKDAALDPSAPSVVHLAAAYLDRDPPGLASAVIERAPEAVRARPEVAQAYARSLFARGHAREALAVARDARDACAAAEETSPADCPAWLMAKTTRQIAFLEEVVSAGI